MKRLLDEPKQVYLAYLIKDNADDLTECDKTSFDESQEIDDTVICVVQRANARSVRQT